MDDLFRTLLTIGTIGISITGYVYGKSVGNQETKRKVEGLLCNPDKYEKARKELLSSKRV